jgi:hypothetical protein
MDAAALTDPGALPLLNGLPGAPSSLPAPLDGAETAHFKALFAAETLTAEAGTRPAAPLPAFEEFLTLPPELQQGPIPQRQAVAASGKVLPYSPLLHILNPVLTRPPSLGLTTPADATVAPQLKTEALAAAGSEPAFVLGGWLFMPSDTVTPDADIPVMNFQNARPASTAWTRPGKPDAIGQEHPQPLPPSLASAPVELMTQIPAERMPITVMPDPAWLRALQGEGAIKLRKDSSGGERGEVGGAAPILPAATEAPKTNSPDQIQLPQPVTQAGFDESLGDQVRWLCKQRIPVAHIDLEPAELGRLQVRISMDEDNARVHFVTQRHETRELLEAAFPKLRETLANDGIHLMDASVEQSPSGQGQASSHLSGYLAGSDPASEDDPVSFTEDVQVSRIRSGSLGLVDLYI